MNEIMYITCSLQTYILSVKFAFSGFFFNFIKLLSNKGHYPYDGIIMVISNVMSLEIIELKVRLLQTHLIDMTLHVSPSTDKGSSFVAQNQLTLIHTSSSKQNLIPH